MIEVSYKKFKGMEGNLFNQAVRKVLAHPTYGHIAYHLNKTLGPLKKAGEQVVKEYRDEIVNVYAKKDEQGKFDENNPQMPPLTTEGMAQAELDEVYKLFSLEQIAAYQNAMESFENRKFTVDKPKLALELIKDVKLSADDLEALSDVLDESSFKTSPATPLARAV